MARWDREGQVRRAALSPEERQGEDRERASEQEALDRLNAANPPREGEGPARYALRIALMRATAA